LSEVFRLKVPRIHAHFTVGFDAQRAEALQREADRKQQRLADARRKLIIGSVVFDEWKAGLAANLDLPRLLGEKLVQERDRILFDLPIMPGQACET